jgi:hypothetical protein
MTAIATQYEATRAARRDAYDNPAHEPAPPDAEPATTTTADAEPARAPGVGFAHVSALISDMTTHAAKEHSRYAINGVLVEQQDDTLAIVATDGRRMAVLTTPHPDAIDGEGSTILPTAAIKAAKIKARDNFINVRETTHRDGGATRQRHKIGFIDGRCSISHDDTINKTFPKWRDVIPVTPNDEPADMIGVNAKYMADAMTLVSKFYKRHGIKGEKASADTTARIYIGPANKPVTITAIADPYTLKIVLMPVTLD